MQFGGNADPNASRELFETARAASLNFFDTAHVYNGGDAERLLGAFARQDRDSLMIATKVAYTGGSSRATILKQFEESRVRLGLDVVDILYLHRWDHETPVGETVETLAKLQNDGKIRHIGASNFAAWQVMKAQAVAVSMGTRIDVLQPMYSLVKRQAEVEILPMAAAERIAVAPYSPLGSGLLTGKYLAGGTGRLSTDKRYAARYGQNWMRDTAQAFSRLAEEFGHDAATLAVAWVAHNPAVTAPIISARNTEQLAPSLKALEISL